jgi:mitogen-activated protein kinase kinase kinase
VLLTDSGVAKLADFGCSQQIALLDTQDREKTLNKIHGSIPWMAPEMIKQTGHDYPADIWSLGCTVLEMATGLYPWPDLKDHVNALWVIASSETPPPGVEMFESPNPLLHDFMMQCFVVDPTDRVTAEQLIYHHFLS